MDQRAAAIATEAPGIAAAAASRRGSVAARAAGEGVRMGPGVFLALWALAAGVALALGRDANPDS